MIKQSTYAWDLMQALEPVSSTSCKTPATFIDSICPNTQPGKKHRGSRNEIQLSTNCRPTYTELRAKRDGLGTQP